MSDDGSIAHDRAVFRDANHRHLTAVEVAVVDPWGTSSDAVVWRLWCMNCNLRGRHLFSDRNAAVGVADSLRSDAEPACQHWAARSTVAP